MVHHRLLTTYCQSCYYFALTAILPQPNVLSRRG